jgi:tRNA(His) 5'-end guanylyltransferase
MPTIIRIDGKAFHTYTRGFEKPWDVHIMEAFTQAGKELMKNIQGCKIAYIQSDEISLLLTDYESLETGAWFGKGVQKMVSVSASICTAAFNMSMRECGDAGHNKTALFDSRVFSIPKEDVCNYFLWRQQDAIRNSIQSLAQAHFPHKSLHGLNTGALIRKLKAEKNIVWTDLPAQKKHGWGIIRKSEPRASVVLSNPPPPPRKVIVADLDIPHFNDDRSFIENLL